MSATPRPPLYRNLNYLGGAAVYAEEIWEVIRNGPLLGGFSRPEIDVLCQFLHCFAAPRDAILLEEGDEGDYVLIVLSGHVEVRKLGPKTESIAIATAGPGSSLGEMSLVDGERRSASCVATEPVDFAVMTRTDLNELMMAHPRLANKFLIKLLQILVDRLRETSVRMLFSQSSLVSVA